MTGKQRTVRRQLFPEKLWELVNMQGSGISWSPDGKKIEVERIQLEKFIGSKFRSHNFNSFIRQLHFYGFRKSGNSYHHDQFQRDQPDQLRYMKRKYSKLTNALVPYMGDSDTDVTHGTSSNAPRSNNIHHNHHHHNNTTHEDDDDDDGDDNYDAQADNNQLVAMNMNGNNTALNLTNDDQSIVQNFIMLYDFTQYILNLMESTSAAHNLNNSSTSSAIYSQEK